ncbi:MAG: hypothetical protein QM762_12230 [Chryseolinea sp.]
MKARHLTFVIFSSLLLFTCDDEDDHVDYPDLHIYVARFIEEARTRGWNFDHSIVEAEYVDVINKSSKIYCGWGYSNYNGTGKRRIEISKSCRWKELSDDDREILVFHELGHAVLNRNHDNEMDCSGEMMSIMNENVPQYKLRDTDKRKYYVDELFDQLAATGKCIVYSKDFKTDPQYYKFSNADPDWYFYSSNGRYTGTLNQSPQIICSSNATTETGYWYRQFLDPEIPHCAEVTLRVKMNSAGLTGNGAAIAVRVYENEITNAGAVTKQTQFLTTEDNPASGELINHTEDLIIPCLSTQTAFVVVFSVMMPGTTGQVSFDDIQLLVKE